jgi:hypothetical protein
VAEDALALVAGQQRIQRGHGDAEGEPGPHRGDEAPRVGQQQRDDIARLGAGPREAPGEPARAPLELSPAECTAVPQQRRLPGSPAGGVGEERGEARGHRRPELGGYSV